MRAVWREVYGASSEGKPRLLGAMTARAEAQVMRLAMLYALLDRSPAIRAEHLQAALAVWEYCEASAAYIFGDALGDPIADRIVRSLRDNPAGVSRTALSSLFGRHESAASIERALNGLRRSGVARPEQRGTGGRPEEVWIGCRR